MTTAASVEEKIIQKIRKVLIEDSTIAGYVNSRVYATHISSINEPIYPAISIHLLLSNPIFAAPGMVTVSLQIDIWLPGAVFTTSDLFTIQNKIKSLLHRQNLTDSVVALKSATSEQVAAGPVLYEEDTKLMHFPIEYRMVAS